MDYSQIIQESWRIAWRNRFLWIFGLFAGTSGGGSCGFNFPGGGGSGSSSGSRSDEGGSLFDGLDSADLQQAASGIGTWVANNIGLILAGVALLMLVGLVLIVLHFIAKGALIGSAARLALGEPATRSEGWAIGRRLAWRYMRLTVLAFLVGLGVLLCFAVIGLIVYLAYQVSGILAVLVGIVLGLATVAVLIAGGIALSVVFAYAERAIAIDDLGARASFRRGIAVVRLRLGPSFIMWLISLALAIGLGIAFLIVALIVLVPVGGAVFVAYASAGLSAGTIVVGGLAVLVFVALMWLLGGIASAFMGTFWTVGYLSATGRWPAR